jgi:hypothetical protein
LQKELAEENQETIEAGRGTLDLQQAVSDEIEKIVIASSFKENLASGSSQIRVETSFDAHQFEVESLEYGDKVQYISHLKSLGDERPSSLNDEEIEDELNRSVKINLEGEESEATSKP